MWNINKCTVIPGLPKPRHHRVLFGLVDSLSVESQSESEFGWGTRSAVIVIQRRSCPVQCVLSLLLLCQTACWWNFYLGLICQRFHLVFSFFVAFLSLQVENFHSHEETFDASEWCDGQVLRTRANDQGRTVRRCWGRGGFVWHWVELTCLTLEPWMVADRARDACWWGCPKFSCVSRAGESATNPSPSTPSSPRVCVCTQFLLSSETKYEMTHLNDNWLGEKTPFVLEKKSGLCN